MKVLFEAAFAKDLKRIKDKQLLHRVRTVIEELKAAEDFSHIRNSRKLQGHGTYYRIRIGDYRIGLEVESDTIYLVRILHRKDIYRKFP